MKTITLILALSLCCCIAFAQDTKEADQKITKNLVYMDYGAGRLGGHVGLNYERTIFSHGESNFALKGSYGVFSYLIPTGDFYSISTHYSYGKRSFHLETAIGATFQDNEYKLKPFSTKNIRTFPLYYIGCKMKKPTDHFLIKFGVGYPQNLSFSFGYAF